MSKLILIFNFLLVTISVTKSAKQQSDVNGNNKMQSKGSSMEMGGENYQDNMNDIDLMTAMSQCNDTFRTEMSFLDALNDSGSFPDETDRTPKCFLRCVLETTRVASEDGEYDASQAAAVFAGERGGKVMDNLKDMAGGCTKRDESCKCERAYQFMKCFMEKEIETYEKSQ